jgi:hypothetical protein
MSNTRTVVQRKAHPAVAIRSKIREDTRTSSLLERGFSRDEKTQELAFRGSNIYFTNPRSCSTSATLP